MKRSMVYIIGGVAAAILVLWYIRRRGRNNFGDLPAQDITYKSEFDVARQGPYFQGMPPSLRVENDYHAWIAKDCGGDYGNLECRQKAYLKAMKNGSVDKADLLCYGKRHNEDDYYACMDGVYGNRIWADQFAGVENCPCPGGRMGTIYSSDGDCFCPGDRPLHDRRFVDANDNIVYSTSDWSDPVY